MFDPSLLDDPRLAMALPPSVIAYLRSPEGTKARLVALEEYRKAAPPPGFEAALSAAIERTHKTFRLMISDGVPLILGSDTPGVDGFGNPPGSNGRLEMQQWADAGAPPAAIFRAATLDNAKALGLANKVGSIETGKHADLLLLGKNPLKDVSAWDCIEIVFVDGKPVRRETLRPQD